MSKYRFKNVMRAYKLIGKDNKFLVKYGRFSLMLHNGVMGDNCFVCAKRFRKRNTLWAGWYDNSLEDACVKFCEELHKATGSKCHYSYGIITIYDNNKKIIISVG